MVREDPEAVLRAMAAPLGAASPGETLPGIPHALEATANAFVMLGLLPGPRVQEILAVYRTELESKGFHIGVLIGELSVRSGAYGFQDAQLAGRDTLTSIPLAASVELTPLPVSDAEVSVTRVTLTPGAVLLGFRAIGHLDVSLDRTTGPGRYRTSPGTLFAAKIQAEVSVTDNLGRPYRLQLVRGRGTLPGARPGQPVKWDGEMLALPESSAAGAAGHEAVHWLEFAPAGGPGPCIMLPAPGQLATGPADPPWPTPAECYLAELAAVTSMSISTDSGTVELDTAQIVSTVADALLRTGALPPESALLPADGGLRREMLPQQAHAWARLAWQQAYAGEPARAALAARLPLRQATAVIETITAHEDLVWIQLYGHPWVIGEYWPMITPCFQVRAVDDLGVDHVGVPGSGGGSPEGSWEFWFWPPVAAAATRMKVTVSTLWEAAWAEIDIPGRPG